MQRRSDGAAAVSPIIGALLLAGLAVTALAILQTSAVPVWNAEIELDHSARVQDDVTRLSAAVTSVAGADAADAVTVELGVDYPNRLVLSNLPAATGSLDLVEGSVAVRGARAVDPAVADYWNGSTHRFRSDAVRYRPDYNYADGAETTYVDDGLVVNRRPGTDEVAALRTDPVVSGDVVAPIVVGGALGRTGSRSVSVAVEPASPARNAVTVTNASAEPITLAFDSPIPVGTWRAALADADAVTSVTEAQDGRVVVALDRGRRYRLRLAAVGLNARRHPPARYLVDAAGNGTRVGVGEPVELVAEARDRFDNPVADASVTATVDGDGTVEGTPVATVRTDGDGRASFTYIPSSAGGATVRAHLDGVSGAAANATFEVTATTAGGGGPSDGTPPTIGDAAVATDTLTDCTLFGCRDVAQQVVVDYTVSDVGSGVRTVAIAVNASAADPPTATAGTQSLDDPASHDGRWVSPWIKDAELAGGDLDGYDVTVRAIDAAGNDAATVVEIGGGGGPPGGGPPGGGPPGQG